MIKEQLFIGGNEIDLLEGEPAAATFQANDINDLTAVKSNFTRRFRAPKTRNNKKNLDDPQITQSTTTKPYELLDVEYKINGIPIMDSGKAYINSSGEFFETTVINGTFNFFDDLENRALSSVNLDSHFFVWDVGPMAALANTTQNTIIPIVDWGSLQETSNLVDTRFQRHGFYVHSLIDKIFEEAGYQREGAIFTDPFYLSLIVPFANEKWYHTKVIVENTNDVNYTITGSGQVTITFNSEVFDQSNEFASNTYVANGRQEQFFKVRMTMQNLSDNVTLRFDSTNNDEIKQSLFIQNNEDSIDIEFAMDEVDVRNGNNLTLKVFGDEGVTFTVKAGVRMYNLITTKNSYIRNSRILIPENLPDMSQKEFVKFIFGLFNAVFTYDSYSNTIKVTKFNEIVDGHYRSVDWSQKYDPTIQPKIDFTLPGYGQVNNASWASDENVPASIGFGSFTIPNENLEKEVILFDSPFAASKMKTTLNGVRMAKIERWQLVSAAPGNLIYDVQFSTEPRLLAVRSETGALVFNDGPGLGSPVNVTDYKVGFFADDSQPINLGFRSIFETYFSGLINALQAIKIVNKYYKLNINDINELDFTEPVFDEDNNEYFYLMNIGKYVPGESSLCKLFRI